MGQELDKQIEDLDRMDKNVEKALDHVDNINVTMKKAVEGVCIADVGYEWGSIYGQLHSAMRCSGTRCIYIDSVSTVIYFHNLKFVVHFFLSLMPFTIFHKRFGSFRSHFFDGVLFFGPL
jgi:hypothetical protein